MKVAIVYDCDKAGREASARRAEELAPFASVLKVVDLGLAEKEDLTDWFVKYERSAQELRQFIKRTAVIR